MGKRTIINKILGVVFLLSIFFTLQGQSPTRAIRVDTPTTTFVDNLPIGTLIIELSSGVGYTTLKPLLGTKSISTCVLGIDLYKSQTDFSDLIETLIAHNDLKAVSPEKLLDFLTINYLPYNEANQPLDMGEFKIYHADGTKDDHSATVGQLRDSIATAISNVDFTPYATKTALGDSTALLREDISDSLFQAWVNIGILASGLQSKDDTTTYDATKYWVSAQNYLTAETDPEYAADSTYIKDNILDWINSTKFTSELNSKLSGIESGAEVNVQADIAETNTEFDSFVKNKQLLLFKADSSRTDGYVTPYHLDSIANEIETSSFWTKVDDNIIPNFTPKIDSLVMGEETVSEYVSGNTIVLSGDNKPIGVSHNGGSSFSYTGSNYTAFWVSVNGDGDDFTCGDGALYYSSDGGQTIGTLSTSIYHANVDNVGWYYTNNSARYYLSTNKGVSWTEITNASFSSVKRIASSGEGTHVVVNNGTGSTILYSSNSGSTFSSRTIGLNADRLAMSGDGSKIIATGNGNGNYIYISTDFAVFTTIGSNVSYGDVSLSYTGDIIYAKNLASNTIEYSRNGGSSFGTLSESSNCLSLVTTDDGNTLYATRSGSTSVRKWIWNGSAYTYSDISVGYTYNSIGINRNTTTDDTVYPISNYVNNSGDYNININNIDIFKLKQDRHLVLNNSAPVIGINSVSDGSVNKLITDLGMRNYVSTLNVNNNYTTQVSLIGTVLYTYRNGLTALTTDLSSLGGGSGGDMFKSVYDTNGNNIVDNSETLQGQNGAYYLNFNNFSNVPVTSSGQFGLVKVDGTTITATDGVISSVGGGGMVYPSGSGIPTINSGSWGTTISPSTGFLSWTGSAYSWATPTLTIRDIDGNPSITANTIEFTNGTVSDQSNGVARVTISGGSMVYPAAGIAVSTGSAWTTSKTAPSGTIVGTTDSQTLTNKSVNGVTLSISEGTTKYLSGAGTYLTIPPQSNVFSNITILNNSGDALKIIKGGTGNGINVYSSGGAAIVGEAETNIGVLGSGATGVYGSGIGTGVYGTTSSSTSYAGQFYGGKGVDSEKGYSVNEIEIIDLNGFTRPKSSTNASAPNNSIYYSTDAAKLVYKDASGTVHLLY